jgi:peptidoglycan/xylan/chitin deacetylase (PgdA/CDA1 family)
MGGIFYRALASQRITRLMNSVVGHYATIYMIHRPRPLDGAYEGVSPALLEQCILYAKSAGFEFASVDDVIEKALAKQKPARPTLCFTLDDGYQDQLDQLVPVLLKHDCKPTLFTIADMVDGVDWPWDSKISDAVWHAQQQQLNFSFRDQQFALDVSSADAKRRSRRELTRFGKRLPADQLNEYVIALVHALTARSFNSSSIHSFVTHIGRTRLGASRCGAGHTPESVVRVCWWVWKFGWL